MPLGPRGTVLDRALVVGLVAAQLSRGPSLVPRTREDQTLITAGAAAMGALAALAVEPVTRAVARRVPGGRAAAGVLVAGAGWATWRWAAPREERTAAATVAETVGGVALVAAGAGEPGGALVGTVVPQLRAHLAGRALVLALAAALAARAVRRKVAEPADRVKVSLRYDYLPSVSGGDGSLAPLETLDREGRKFLGLAVPVAAIRDALGEDARDPIRVYVGLETAGTPHERARRAVAELERLGAFDRRRILVACPSGAGFVTPVPVEAEEYMTRGDVASVAVQYNNQRSHRSVDKVPVGVETTRILLGELRARLDAMPSGDRPELLVYGESMGAWVAAEVLVEGGLQQIDELRVARGMLIGVPFQAMRSLARLGAGGPLPGTIGVFRTAAELVAGPEDMQRRVRYVLLTHPEDPVANFGGLRLLVERPSWLTMGERRHPRVPREMRWLPGITYLQVLFDVKNGTSFTADFAAYAHDYRRGLPAVIRVAYGHLDAVSPEQLAAIERRTAESAHAQARRESAARGQRG